MSFSYIKSNPSKFIIPNNNDCIISNVYDIPLLNPMVETVKQCSRRVEQFQNKNNDTNIILRNKKYLWTFVEENTPEYIKLNIDSFIKYYSNEYEVVVLDKNNLYSYLPNFRLDMTHKDTINMNKKVEFLKYSLLYNYGGLWIDSSTLIYKYFDFNNYNNYDLVLFKNPNVLNFNNRNDYFNTKIILCKPKLNLMKDLLDNYTSRIMNNFNFNEQFSNISEIYLYEFVKLYNSVDNCNKRYSNINIMILDSNYIAKIIDNHTLLTRDYLKHYKYRLNSNSFCTFIDNNDNYYKSPQELFYKDMWFLNNREELLKSSMFISYLYRLNI